MKFNILISSSKNNWALLILIALLATYQTGCSVRHKSQEKKFFILPNGDEVHEKTIKDVEQKFELTYQDYQGFTGNYFDSFFKKIVFVQETEIHEIVHKEDIELLKPDDIVRIQLVSETNDVASFDRVNITRYIKSKYNKYRCIQISDNKFKFVNMHGEIVCDAEYISQAVPHYLINLYPVVHAN